jgi:hypothetical protein
MRKMRLRQAALGVTLGLLGFRVALQMAVSHVKYSALPKEWLLGVWSALRTDLPLGALVSTSVIVFVAGLFLLIRTTQGTLLEFLSERESATFLLVIAFSWSAPMLLAPGALLGGDWGPQLRAALLASDSMRSLELPVWTFLFGNGASYTLQYPPLATLLVAGMVTVTRLSAETCFKLLCAGMHGVFLVGGYRLARLFGLSRLPAVAGVILVTLTQQYWATGLINGAVPSVVAFSLLPLLLYAFIRTFQTGMARYAAVSGCLLGCMVMAQPVMALFSAYTLALGTLAVLLFRPGFAISRAAQLLFAGAITACVASPFLLTIFAFRAYNQYQFSKAVWQFHPVSLLRWLWWSPRIGLPPGIGDEKSGYIGVSILVANLIAVAVALKRSEMLLSRCYLGCLAWGLILVYAPGHILDAIPFAPLAKGTFRLWPFLGLALMLGVAIATRWLLDSHRYVFVSALIFVGLLENAPFSIKPLFYAPDNSGREVLDGTGGGNQAATFLVTTTNRGNPDLTWNVERDVSLERLPSLYYIHHEELGIMGSRFWQLSDLIDQAPPGTDWRRVCAQLAWLRVTRLIVLGRSATDYPGFGSAFSRTIDGTPVMIVPLDQRFPMTRETDTASIQVPPDELSPDGSVRLPISYHPILRVQWRDQNLTTRSDEGYLSACCVRSEGALLRITAHRPPWLKWLYALSLSSFLATFFLCARRRSSHRSVN